MKRVDLFTLDTPYREPLAVEGMEFGRPGAARAVAVVGSMRGNEVQQTYVCADLVRRLEEAEERGQIADDKKVLVIPAVNSFSMNIHKRFWPVDNTDINRMFPGYDAGETTQRIAAGLFDAVKDYECGVQLASFYLRGEFLPHVRVTQTGPITDEALEMAADFGFPYCVRKEPSSFDTTTLNYNWQVWGTRAFSIYTKATGSLDVPSAEFAEDCVMRFLAARGVLRHGPAGGYRSQRVDEADLADVRCLRAAGFFRRRVGPGERVAAGQVMAEVLDTFDLHVKERLVSPVAGRVFFARSAPVVNQYTVAFKVVPEEV